MAIIAVLKTNSCFCNINVASSEDENKMIFLFPQGDSFVNCKTKNIKKHFSFSHNAMKKELIKCD